MKNYFLSKVERYFARLEAIQTPQGQEKWEKTRAMGRARFVWQIGVGIFGSLTFLVWTPTFFFVMNRLPSNSQLQPIVPSMPMLAVILLIWLVGGYMWGTAVWYTMEWILQRHTKEVVDE